MKWLLFILLFASCTSAKTLVVIDARQSYVSGGDGHGYLTSWEWKRDGVILSRKPYDTITIEGAGTFTYTITLTDNSGQIKSENKTVTVPVK